MSFDIASFAMGKASGGGGGGGGGGNIYRGTSTPDASIGSEGDCYIKCADASLVSAVYYKLSGGWTIVWSSEVWIMQDYTGDANVIITYIDESTLEVEIPHPGSNCGIVFSTSGWNPTITITTSSYWQAGRCQKSATLPTITTQGTGRPSGFSEGTGNGSASFTYSNTHNFYAGALSAQNSKIRISKS